MVLTLIQQGLGLRPREKRALCGKMSHTQIRRCPLNSNPETHEPHHQSHLEYPEHLLLYRVSCPAVPKHTTHTKQIAHYKHEIKITRNGYFTLNHRHIQITLPQIRLEFSNLNKHLLVKGCLNSFQCEGIEAVQTPLHYFLKCNIYNIRRPIMMQTLSKYAHHASDSTLMHIILEGNGNEFENV